MRQIPENSKPCLGFKNRFQISVGRAFTIRQNNPDNMATLAKRHKPFYRSSQSNGNSRRLYSENNRQPQNLCNIPGAVFRSPRNSVIKAHYSLYQSNICPLSQVLKNPNCLLSSLQKQIDILSALLLLGEYSVVKNRIQIIRTTFQYTDPFFLILVKSRKSSRQYCFSASAAHRGYHDFLHILL